MPLAGRSTPTTLSGSRSGLGAKATPGQHSSSCPALPRWARTGSISTSRPRTSRPRSTAYSLWVLSAQTSDRARFPGLSYAIRRATNSACLSPVGDPLRQPRRDHATEHDTLTRWRSFTSCNTARRQRDLTTPTSRLAGAAKREARHGCSRRTGLMPYMPARPSAPDEPLKSSQRNAAHSPLRSTSAYVNA
jgi:hypothetical protein